MSEMLRQDSTLYFDNNLCIYHYSYIKKSLFMDIWIFFINFITFDDKSAERFIILSKNIDLTFKSLDIYCNSYNSVKKPHKTNFTIRLDNISINKTYKIRNNRPDIFILDKKKNKITLIEVGITSQDSLQIVETEKLRKYDLLANELGLIYKCSVEIIPYVMTWDGIVTKYHKSHLKRLEIPMNVEAYIQSIVLKKTVETISFDRRRGLESGLNAEESWERASMGVIMRSEMHEEPIPPLKEAKTEEDGAKNFKPKYKAPFILQGGTTLEEPTNNINEESDLEEETKVVKEVEENM
ncbi:hypothetical protein LUQ84_001911 [Hamiltosporidium tvaerminnensis]|nr:hypothetical protein LUQ84_001911 [Hamiltosporidium tvaerminnensis]